MTTPARTATTSPTTGDAEAARSGTPRNGTRGRRADRPLVATRTAPRTPRAKAAGSRVGTDTAPATAPATTPATDPTTARETGTDAGVAPAVAGPTSRRPLVVAIAALVAAGLVTVFAYSVWHMRTVDARNARLSAQSKLGASALAAATTYGGYLSSYNYKTLHASNSAWAKVEANATASFKKDFTSTSGSLGNLLTQYNATATGKVIAAGVQSVSSTRAVVLLFVDQTVTNTVQKPNSVTQPLRVQLTMQRQNGKWLIDNLQVPN